jgi:hypothetical protein
MRPDILADHLGLTIRGLMTPLASRVAALEARATIPGPPGPPGPSGPPGRDGLDGKDGAPGLRYLGVHVTGKTYDTGDLVTAGGSAWYCGRTTTTDPGKSADWQLMVKRGRDAR